MSRIRLAVALALTIGMAHGIHADTLTGTVTSPTATVRYTFTPPDSGQALVTLSWTTATAKLFFTTVCGTDNPITFGVAGAGLDRVARAEMGLIGGVPCVIALSSFEGGSPFQINFETSGRQGAGALASVAFQPARERTLLSDAVDRVMQEIRALNR